MRFWHKNHRFYLFCVPVARAWWSRGWVSIRMWASIWMKMVLECLSSATELRTHGLWWRLKYVVMYIPRDFAIFSHQNHKWCTSKWSSAPTRAQSRDRTHSLKMESWTKIGKLLLYLWLGIRKPILCSTLPRIFHVGHHLESTLNMQKSNSWI